MPTVLRGEGWRICVFADDHAPPHFHVMTPEASLRFTIPDARRLDPLPRRAAKAVAAASAAARAQMDVIEAEWRRLNGRG